MATMATVALSVLEARSADTACSKDRAVTLDGSCWNSLSPSEKDALIQGIWAGAESRSIADSLIGESAWRGRVDRLEIPGGTTTADIIGRPMKQRRKACTSTALAKFR